MSALAECPTDRLSALPAADFDLEATLTCGQVFHWQRRGSGFLGLIGDLPVYVEQRGEELLVTRGVEQEAARYFALDHPLLSIRETFPTDGPMREAAAFCRGLRILRQPLWECLATFLTSSMKQVAHIAQMSHAIRRRFGREIAGLGETFHTYPSAAVLAKATEADLRACSLGYRAANLLATARMVAGGEVDLERVKKLPAEEALERLCTLPGVGVKVANCVLLFAFERLGAFPIDVWIERVLRERYFKGKRKVTQGRLQEYSRSYFGPYGGYAQQYLFHHARQTWTRPKKLKTTRARKAPKAHAD
jgi:N-glycosylase/DNA lyase